MQMSEYQQINIATKLCMETQLKKPLEGCLQESVGVLIESCLINFEGLNF